MGRKSRLKRERRENSPEKTPPELTQRERIDRLQQRIATFGGHTPYVQEGVDPDILESFLENVVAIEEAGTTVPAEQLEEGGLDLLSPDELAKLSDEEVAGKLHELIQAMALRNTFVTSTDHLSDRELYAELHESLQEEFFAPPETRPGYNSVIDLVSSGSDEHNYLMLKYYSDDAARRSWAESFPEDEIPAREKPPYDRDRFLPQPDFSIPASDDDGSDEPVM